MTRRSILGLVLLAAIAGCDRSRAPLDDVQAPADQHDADIDADNLLNLAYGASLVSRTGELHLEASALDAIDGFGTTVWASPPGGATQTLVFGLAARSRIERLGVSTVEPTNRVPDKIRFEASLDGRGWREVLVFEPKATLDKQLEDVTPFEALYIRVTTLETDDEYAQLRSVHAIGKETGPPHGLALNGCWIINGSAARFTQEGSHISGTIAADPPIAISGGTDGRVAKVIWRRGPMWGYAAMTTGPDNQTFSAASFHENVSMLHSGEAWIGSRAKGNECAQVRNVPSDPEQFLSRAGRWPMYGLVFDTDDRLVDGPSRTTLDLAANAIARDQSRRFRIVAREFHERDAEQNHRRTAKRVAAVRNALQARGADTHRIDFVAVGSEWTEPQIETAVQRLLMSSVELEVRR